MPSFAIKMIRKLLVSHLPLCPKYHYMFSDNCFHQQVLRHYSSNSRYCFWHFIESFDQSCTLSLATVSHMHLAQLN